MHCCVSKLISLVIPYDVMIRWGDMSTNFASDRKFWQNFGALCAPTNFESNFGKSLAGPSGMGGAASGRAENPCGKSTRTGHSTTISHVHYDVHDSSRASQEPTGSPSAAGAFGSSTIACGGDRTHPSFTHVHAATESPGDARTERSARSGTAGRALEGARLPSAAAVSP